MARRNRSESASGWALMIVPSAPIHSVHFWRRLYWLQCCCRVCLYRSVHIFPHVGECQKRPPEPLSQARIQKSCQEGFLCLCLQRILQPEALLFSSSSGKRFVVPFSRCVSIIIYLAAPGESMWKPFGTPIPSGFCIWQIFWGDI